MNSNTPQIQNLRNRTMPACTIIPVLYYEKIAEAITWLCNTFGFRERWRVGTHRAQLSFKDGAIAVSSLNHKHSESLIKNKQSIMVRVDDVDQHAARAARAGAHILQKPTDFPYGERQYTVQDIEGHLWTFSQSINDVLPEDWGGTSANLD